MSMFGKNLCVYPVALLTMLSTSMAWAGGGAGTITYAPAGGYSVPTLSGWVLVIMAALIGVIVFRVLRARNMRAPLAVIVASGMTGLVATTGVKLISDTEAAATFIALNVQTGSIEALQTGDHEYRNTTTVSQRIVAITTPIFCDVSATSLPGLSTCAVGNVLTAYPAAGSSCGLNVDCTK